MSDRETSPKQPTRIHVVFLIRSLEVGGAENQLALLARRLSRDVFRVTIVCYYGHGALRQPLERDGVSVVVLGKRSRWDLLRFGIRLVRCVRGLRPDVIHSFMGPSNVLAIGLKLFVPRMRAVWGLRSSSMDFQDYDATWRFVFMLERRLSRWADAITANSFAGRDHLRAERFYDGRMSVVPNGIDTERFGTGRAGRDRLRQEWNVDPADYLIGLIARQDSKKDHASFLRAAAKLAADREDVRFVCVGGEGRIPTGQLKTLASSLGIADRVIWAGFRGDVAEVLAAIDLMTSASAYGEGFPNVVGEAMAMGLPIVVTDVGDSARIVGDLGVVIPPRDPDMLARGWAQALSAWSQETEELAAFRRKRIIDNFSVERMVEKMSEIYLDVAWRGGAA